MNKPTAEELKPCPFCGCEGWIHSSRVFDDGAIGYRVECEGQCHAMTCYWHTIKEAIKAWNQRKEADQIEADQKLIEALELENKSLHSCVKSYRKIEKLWQEDRKVQ